MGKPLDRLKIRLGSNVARDGSTEKTLLFVSFIMIYWAYAGLGRDIFFNKLNNPTAYDPIGAVINYVRMFACIVGMVVVVSHTTFNWALSRIPLQYMPFIMFALASVAWADNPMPTFQNAVLIAALWLVLPVVIHRLGAVASVQAALHLIAGVCIASFLLAILVPAIGKHTGFEAVQYVHAGRWRGIFGHKNGLGPWAAYGTVFLFTHSWLASGPRLYWWFARLSAISCLIFAESSTAVVMVLALIACWAWLKVGRTVSGATLTIATIGSLLIGSILYYFVADSLFGLLNRDTSFSGRTLVWEIALDHIWDRPWTGHGYQSLGGDEFLVLLERIVQQAIPGAESGYLTLMLDLGITGLLLFFVPYALSIFNGMEWLRHVGQRDRSAIEFMIMTLGCVLVHAVTESGALVSVGFDGVISFGAIFFLASLPRSPAAILRANQQLIARALQNRRARRHRSEVYGAKSRSL